MSAILYDSRDGIAEITINRPENYNILTHEVVAELHDAWVRFNEGSVVIKHCIQQGIVAKGISPVSSRLRQAR